VSYGQWAFDTLNELKAGPTRFAAGPPASQAEGQK